jgi:hypothetical protein
MAVTLRHSLSLRPAPSRTKESPDEHSANAN